MIWKPEHYLKWLRRDKHESADYRLRVGDYRVLIDWRRDEGMLFVTEVEHRDTIYD